MNSQNNNKDYLTLTQLIRYVEKKLSGEELNQIEIILDNNPLCNDALEGFLLYVEQEGIDESKMERLLKEIGTSLGFKDDLVHHPDEKQGVYTLDELLGMFGKVEHYESLLLELTAHRSGAVAFEAGAQAYQKDDLTVISPQNGEDCSDTICFILNQETSGVLLLTIENNQEEILLEHDFPANTDVHQIDITRFSPGRYYWRLILNDEDFLLGSFFIRKDLMPRGL